MPAQTSCPVSQLIHILDYGASTKNNWKVKNYKQVIFPVLTPRPSTGHPPHISNLSLNLAVVVRDE
jgi:polyphosphate kinase